MKLSLPFKGNFPAGQMFGQNFNGYYEAEGLKGHQGIDFPMPNGTPVYSSVNGTVIAVSKDIQKGEGVAIMSSDIFQYKGQDCLLDTIYWHLKDGSILVNIGDKVTVGQQIGLSNNTGQTTGPHLHFSVIPMATDGSRRTLESYDNGYRACVNPLIFLDLPKIYPVLKFGSRGEQVKELQTKLGKLTVDGKFGKQTLNAVKDFQNRNGLTIDGIVGNKTWEKLNVL